MLWIGEIKSIITKLSKHQRTKEVKDCIGYYNNNINRMDYKKYRDQGMDIGSGAIESAHRTIIQYRMKQAGMYWGKKNVQSMASIRAKYLSGDWDEIVQKYLVSKN